jgi:hypothetical protein
MSTGKLNTPPDKRLLAAARSARGAQADDIEYSPVPAHARPSGNAPWRIQLRSTNPAHPLIALDMYGDVALGRGGMLKGGPDVSLQEHDTDRLGVSRRHILLRPTRNHLYMIDLNSTNGTLLNGAPVGPSNASPLYDGDTITLGDLHLVLRLIRTPEGVQAQRKGTAPLPSNRRLKVPKPARTPTLPAAPRPKTKPLPPHRS